MSRQSKATRRIPRCPKCGRSGVRLQSTEGCGPCTVNYLTALTARRMAKEQPLALRGFLDALSSERSQAVRGLLRKSGLWALALAVLAALIGGI